MDMAQRTYKRSTKHYSGCKHVQHHLQQSTICLCCIGIVSYLNRSIARNQLGVVEQWYLGHYEYHKRNRLTNIRFQISPGSWNGRQRRVLRLNPIKRPTKRSMDRARGDECCGLGTNFSLFCRTPPHITHHIRIHVEKQRERKRESGRGRGHGA